MTPRGAWDPVCIRVGQRPGPELAGETAAGAPCDRFLVAAGICHHAGNSARKNFLVWAVAAAWRHEEIPAWKRNPASARAAVARRGAGLVAKTIPTWATAEVEGRAEAFVGEKNSFSWMAGPVRLGEGLVWSYGRLCGEAWVASQAANPLGRTVSGCYGNWSGCAAVCSSEC